MKTKNTELREYVANALKERREELGFSVSQIARRMDTSFRTYYEMETARTLTLNNISAAMEVLGLELIIRKKED